MTKGKGFRFVPAAAITGLITAAALSNGCSAASTIAGAAQGCNEFPGSIASLQGAVDVNTLAFVQAAGDLVTIAGNMENAVYTACKNIDSDLMVTDTWSSMSGLDAQTTEACNQAANAVNAVLSMGASAMFSCELSITQGVCTVDANVQASCQGSCSGSASCTPPDLTVACQPGDLSVQCSGMCKAMATCEGSVMVAANCQGSCQADCSGECDVTATQPQVRCEGTCMGMCTGTCDGNAAMGTSCMGKCSGKCSANCMYTGGVAAHCDGSCKGTCTGNCTLDANAMVMCGANVSCKGGCSGTATAPKCEGKITPPSCMASASCQASCQSHAEINAMCTPPSVSLECDGTVSTQLTAVITTLQKNLPALIQALVTQGKLAVEAAGNVVSTGQAVVSGIGSAGGKALACATVAAQGSVTASASVNVSVSASASVSGKAGGPSS
jgi:hypothetical protein